MNKILCTFSFGILLGGSTFAAFDPSRDPSVPLSERKLTTTVTTSVNPSNSNSVRVSSGLRSQAPVVYAGSQTEDLTDLFTSESGFSIRLPKGFEVQEDLLSEDLGSYTLKREQTVVKLQKTKDTCGSSISQQRACLQLLLNEEKAEALKRYKLVEREDAREFTLSYEGTSQRSSSVALWSRSNVDGNKFGIMAFLKADTGHIWMLTVEGPEEGEFFKQPRYLAILAQSLTQKELIKTVSSTIPATTNRSSVTNQGLRVPAASRVIVTSNITNSLITSHDLSGLTIELPKEYILTEDAMEEELNRVVFEKGEQKIVLQSTREICPVKKEVKLRRACIEKFSANIKNEFEENNPQFSRLLEENMSLDLFEDASQYQDDIARFVTWFQRDNRFGQLVFVHPINNEIWFMEFSNKNERNEILADNQSLQKALRSLKLK